MMLLMDMIPLTKGLAARVDPEDYQAVMSAGPWHAIKTSSASSTFYAQRRTKAAEGGGCRLQYLHTFLTGFRQTDHRNGDGLDNRRSNLREVSHSQNQANRRPTVGSSPFKGVTWDVGRSRWRAQIMINRKRKYLGLFDNDEAAARAYDEAARAHHGEFARLNFEESGSDH